MQPKITGCLAARQRLSNLLKKYARLPFSQITTFGDFLKLSTTLVKFLRYNISTSLNRSIETIPE